MDSMSKTTQELKGAVEARIDIEQRRLILQILSNEDTLDEQTTDKLQQLMREVERREQNGESPATSAEQLSSTRQPAAPEPAAAPAMPYELMANKMPLPAKEGTRPAIEEAKPLHGSSREHELAELERKNAEMSQLLEQLTKEKQNTLMNHLAQDADLGGGDFAYHAHHVAERLNKDEPGWFRIYLPIFVLIILIGLAVWAFLTFVPIQPTL